MTRMFRILKSIVTALCLILAVASPLTAQQETLDGLFEQLSDQKFDAWKRSERKIWAIWSRSGSDSMDLLLERGHKALEAEDLDAAIEHFTALTDHAPEFAEGWNARATAYFMAGLYGPSIEDIRRTLSLNPRHFGALSGLGRILEDLGHPRDALYAYRRVQAIHPRSPGLEDTIRRLEETLGGTSL